MLFIHTWEKVLSGEKTQTRRIVKPWEFLRYDENPVWNAVGDHRRITSGGDSTIKYQMGHTYAVQPGRGKKAVARIRITAIRREDVREISEDDARAEGFDNAFEFLHIWCAMHDREALTTHNEIAAATVFEIASNWSKIYSDQYLSDWRRIGLSQRPAERYDAWVLGFKLVQND